MNKKSKTTIVITLLLIAVMLPLSAFAGSVSDGGVTLTVPDDSIDCIPTFTISVDGVDPSWLVVTTLFRTDASGTQITTYRDYGNQNITWSETLSTVDEVNYFVQVTVFGPKIIKLSGKWHVSCDEGCTPGFWKNHSDWFPISPDTPFDIAFGGEFFDPDITMFDAVNLKGGGLNVLTRHAAAAYLNAAAGLDYPLEDWEIVSMFNAAFSSGDFNPTKDEFDLYNNLFCPLG